jgi:hypothetical protein
MSFGRSNFKTQIFSGKSENLQEYVESYLWCGSQSYQTFILLYLQNFLYEPRTCQVSAVMQLFRRGLQRTTLVRPSYIPSHCSPASHGIARLNGTAPHGCKKPLGQFLFRHCAKKRFIVERQAAVVETKQTKRQDKHSTPACFINNEQPWLKRLE